MNRRNFLLTASLASMGVAPLIGCGSSGRGTATGRGRIQMTLRWPDLTVSRLIPAGSNGVTVQLFRDNVLVQERKVSRNGGTTAQILFENLPIGDYLLQASAYPNSNGSGTAQATGSVGIPVTDGVTAEVHLTMDSTISTLNLSNKVLLVGDSTTLSVTASTVKNETVLVALSALRWSSSAPSILSIDTSGVATALQIGTATVSVTDTESGQSAQALITINAKPTIPPVPLFLYNQRRTGRSYYSSSATGTLKWKYQTGKFIWASPVIGNDGTIYVASSDGKMYALDGQTGAKKWEFIAQTDSSLVMHSTSAIGLDNTIYFGSESGLVYALNGNTGTVKWSYSVGRPIDSSPVIDNLGTLYIGTGGPFGSGTGSVIALNTTNGTKKWETSTTNGIESSPSLAADGTLYIGDGGFGGGNVYALDSASGAKKWTWAAPGGVESSPSIGDDGTVYVGTRLSAGGLFALDGANGTVKWKFSAFDVRGCPAIGDDGSLYFPSSDGNIYSLTQSGSLKWKFQTGDQCKATPILAPNGVLYGGGKDGYLYALNSTDGTLIWKFNAGDYMFSSPAIGKDGTIYFTDFDGAVYALS